MKQKEDIRNLDSLEKEIYRLKLTSKNMEEKLDKNLDYLQDNYWTMTMNSIFCKDDGKANPAYTTFSKHEGFNSTINRIAGTIADKASEKLHVWMNNFFGKNK